MTGLALADLARADFRTTRSADEVNSQLQRLLGLPHRYGPARLAIARSLSVPAAPVALGEDEEAGKAIKGENLFGTGSELATWVALVVEHAKADPPTRRVLQDLVAAHWARGIDLLWTEWKECDSNFERFIDRLFTKTGFATSATPGGDDERRQESGAKAIELRLGHPGTEYGTEQPVTWTLNARGVSPHIAVLGTLGTGKTRLAVDLVRQAATKSGCAVLVFDMGKGDLAEDSSFASAIGARVLRVPDEPVPLDFLALRDRTEAALNNAALRFRESFQFAAPSSLGSVQLDIIREATRFALKHGKAVDLNELRDALLEQYRIRERKEDGAIATFNDFCAFHLLAPTMSPKDFFSRSWIIDLHQAPETVQRLVVYLVLDAADTYLKELRDSPLDAAGNRSLRLIMMIDEARRVLGYPHRSLIELVRTSRSKGGVVTMISQSPDDFDGQEENFLENVGLVLSFRTNAMKKRILTTVFGQKIDLAGLASGVCVTRLPDRRGVTRVQAWS